MYTRTEYQQLQHRLGTYFVSELEEIAQAYKLGGDAMTNALNQFDQEWHQIRQLWEQLITRGTSDDVVLCSRLVRAFQPYLLARVSIQPMRELLEKTLDQLPADAFAQARLATLFLLGSTDQLMTHYEPMLHSYQQAMALEQAQDFHWYQNEIDNKLSHYHFEHARYEDALKHARRVLQKDSGANEIQRASAKINMGNVYTNQQNFVEAEHYLRQGLAYFDEVSDQNSAMHAHVNLGRLFASKTDYKQAAYHYGLGLEINNRTGKNMRISATIFFNLAIVANRRGDYAETYFYARLAMADYQAIDNQWGISRALNTMGIAHLRQGRHKQADTIFREVMTMRYKEGFISGLIFVVANLVQNWNLAGEYKQAFDVLQDHLQEIVQQQSNLRPRFRLVALSVWTFAGLKLISPEFLKLLAFIHHSKDIDWETDTFIERIEACLKDQPLPPVSSEPSSLTTDDALQRIVGLVQTSNLE